MSENGSVAESLVVSRQLSLAQSSDEIEHRARKLYKATYQRSSPSTNASIPSKYRTYFTPNVENKGFNSQAIRFQTHAGSGVDADNPGPGCYPVHRHSSLTVPEVSLSKRGTGGFASKARRFRSARSAERLSGKVGPTTYTPILPSNRVDFNRTEASRNFQSSVLTDKKTTKDDETSDNATSPNGSSTSSSMSHRNTGPAPNSYQNYIPTTERLVGGKAPFKSKTQRGLSLGEQVDFPGPGKYNPYRSNAFANNRMKTANFLSKTKRTQPINNLGNPGPADYFRGARSSSSLPYYKQKHYLCISAPAIPLPPLPPTPGPGHYELIQNTSDEQLVGGAVFKSTSSRWKGDNTLTNNNPGPGTYNPKSSRKQSFLYNWNQQWI